MKIFETWWQLRIYKCVEEIFYFDNLIFSVTVRDGHMAFNPIIPFPSHRYVIELILMIIITTLKTKVSHRMIRV